MSSEEIIPGDIVAVNHGYGGRREGLVVGSHMDYAGRQIIEVQLDGEVFNHCALSSIRDPPVSQEFLLINVPSNVASTGDHRTPLVSTQHFPASVKVFREGLLRHPPLLHLAPRTTTERHELFK
ncbi:hypothetical protein PQX77_007686 [Marasmius sp. AFHP31]|nr:hypothetical protein PQX77_007686 [Marasmius sp. AFHP31]